jgi:rubrerythrin
MEETNMSTPFNADEILEMAEQIERNGARFYRRAAEGAVDPRNRQLLSSLISPPRKMNTKRSSLP